MEARHYLSFEIALVALQLMLWVFARTLSWIFKLEGKSRRRLAVWIFVILNCVMLSAPLRLFTETFIVSAFTLTLLLFSGFSSVIVGVLHVFFKKWDKALKLLYPIIFLGFIGLGFYNAYTPMVNHYQVRLNKLMQPLRIGMASDTHLGTLFGAKQLDKLAAIMQQEKVDIILLPGDIMDDNVNAYLAEKMQPHLAKLKAPMGVYATLGNHDLFGDQDRIDQEIRKAGITVLRDEILTLNNELVLIGRNDNLAHDRPSTETLLKQVNTDLPIILLDHRPTDIEKHASLPLDIQVSGHAHKGQVFPASLITKMMYRLDYGHEKIGNPHFFVTSGYGFWGIPMRLGSQSEVIIIDVKGK